MRYVGSDQFTEGIDEFFSLKKEKPVMLTQSSNWCPQDTKIVKFLGTKVQITEAVLIQNLCAFEIQSVDKTILEYGVFTFSIQAESGSGAVKTIEFDQQRALFKHEGLVFQSTDLSEKFKKVLMSDSI